MEKPPGSWQSDLDRGSRGQKLQNQAVVTHCTVGVDECEMQNLGTSPGPILDDDCVYSVCGVCVFVCVCERE